MPLGSSKFFSKNHTAGAPGQDPAEPVNVVITSTVLTGQTDSALTVDANIVTVAFTINRSSPLGGIAVGYEISGNISASDFTDGTLSGNITTVDGIGGLNKTITTTTGGGAKDFVINIVRPEARTEILATTNTLHLYEIIPANVTGGDVVNTSSFVVADANGNNHIVAHKVHEFTTTGNASLVINSKGNLEGNTTIWNTFLNSSNTNSYWNTTDANAYGVNFRSLLAGGGGGGGGSAAGAGELGVLKYEYSSIENGTYIMSPGEHSATSGNAIGQSFAFRGNATLQRFAINGGAGGGTGTPGGSGGGQQTGNFQNYNGWCNVDIDVGFGQGKGFTDLYDKRTTAGTYSDYVAWASGNNGGQAPSLNVGAGGAGAFGRPQGAGGGVSTGSYGFNIILAPSSGSGSGVSWPGLKDGNQTDIFNGAGSPPFTERFPHRWNDNPVYTAISNTELNMAGAGGALGGTGFGGAGNDGAVTFSYPYVVATRFLSTTDLS